MNDRHADFDTDHLFHLKDHHLGYRFCPKCATELQADQIDGRQRMACPDTACGYIFYQNPIPAAGVMIVENDQVLLVKRAHPPRIGWWCIPAGFMEWDEGPEGTAVRELAEETGLEVELDSLFDVYSGDDDPRTNALLVLYLGHAVGGTLQAADDALDVAYFSLDDLPDKIAFEAHIQALQDYDRRFRKPGHSG